MVTTEAILRRRAKHKEEFDRVLQEMIHEALSEQGYVKKTHDTSPQITPTVTISEELLSQVINKVFDKLNETKPDSPNLQCPTISSTEIAAELAPLLPSASEAPIDNSKIDEGFSLIGSKVDVLPSKIITSINERLAELKDGIDLSAKTDKCEASYKKLEEITTLESLLLNQKLDRVSLSDLKELISHAFLIKTQKDSLSEVYATYESLQAEYDGNSRKKIRNTKFNEKTQEKNHYNSISNNFEPVLSSLDEHIKGLNELMKTFFKSSTSTHHQAAKNLKKLCSDFQENSDFTKAVDDYCSLCSTNVEYSSKPETTYLCGLNIICEELV